MIVYPRKGQQVQVWYNKRLATFMPLHGKVGTVCVVAKGKGPRNHGVEIDGVLWVVPCGNIRNVQAVPSVDSAMLTGVGTISGRGYEEVKSAVNA